MKLFIIILGYTLLTSQVVIGQKSTINNCIMLDSILNIKDLRESVGISGKPNKIIRVIDSKKYLKKCSRLKRYPDKEGLEQVVIIDNIIPLDVNCGLYADLFLLEINKVGKKIEFIVFFVKNECEENIKHKYMCRVVFDNLQGKVFIDQINFSHIQ